MMLAHRWPLIVAVSTLGFGLLVGEAQEKKKDAAAEKKATIAPAEAVKDGWEQIDERLVFLMIRLANTETSLEAVEKSIAANSRKQAVKIGDAKRAVRENEKMDRNGGGPMKWSKFYGTTADKFFYHPTDRNSTYHTLTVLSQQQPNGDGKGFDGTTSSQGLPIHNRPPQFDYIYRANQEASKRAEDEAAQFKGQVGALIARRNKLELEQVALWTEIAFRSVGHYDLDKKPLFRFEPSLDRGNVDAKLHADVMRTVATFLRVSLSIVDEASKDQAATLVRIKPAIAEARQVLNDSWLRLAVEASDKTTTEGKFAALAKRLDDVASNLSESYVVSVDGDNDADQLRKETFRGQLQESLVGYAQIVLALDEMATELRDKWMIKPDLDRPYGPVSLAKYAGVSASNFRTDTFSNSIGMTMNLIPAGDFMMGASQADVASYLKADNTFKAEHAKASQPQHRVQITKAFYMAAHETTQAQYEQIMGINPSHFSTSGPGSKVARDKLNGLSTGRFPVEQVSWFDAAEFCNKLSSDESRSQCYRISNVTRSGGSIRSADVTITNGDGYRLPTEAEWEYACRGRSVTPFYFGFQLNGEEANSDGNLPFGTPRRGPSIGRTTTVGSFSGNAFGLYDMHGNVWEWCQDVFDSQYYAQRVERDPVGPNVGGTRVLRGGSWADGGGSCRATGRGNISPESTGGHFGFRVVCMSGPKR